VIRDTRKHKFLNTLQSVLLLSGMAALAAFLGWTLFGNDGVVWAVVVGALAMAIGPGLSPRWVLRMSGGREISEWQAPLLHQIVGQLSERAALTHAPRLYYIPTRVLNAFAIGTRTDSAIAVTDGLLRALDLRELAGVLAHEVAHVRSNDLWVMNLADVAARLTSLMSFLGQALLILMLPMALLNGFELPVLLLAVLILAPMVSGLLQLALSRTREYHADLEAVDLTRDPVGLAAALDKLERLQDGWIERFFMGGGRIPHWLRTHPIMAERIARLLELETDAHSSVQFGSGLAAIRDLPTVTRRPRWHWSGLWY